MLLSHRQICRLEKGAFEWFLQNSLGIRCGKQQELLHQTYLVLQYQWDSLKVQTRIHSLLLLH